MKKLIILIGIMLISNILLAENVPAIKNSRTNIVYTNFDVATENAIASDTFEIGIYDESFVVNKSNGYNGLVEWYSAKDVEEIKLKHSDGGVYSGYYIYNNLKTIWEFIYADDNITVIGKKYYCIKE